MYSPLRPRTTGASTWNLVPSSSSSTRSTICCGLCRAIGRPQTGQCGLPDPRVQQPQVVVDLGDRADGRARVAARPPSGRWTPPGDSPSMKSTSGLSIWPRNCRAYADSDSTYRRWPSAKIVSKARLDFPDPDSPVNTIRASRGRSSETSLRLCSRAPRTTRRSATVRSALRSLTSVFRGSGGASPWYPGGLTKRGASARLRGSSGGGGPPGGQRPGRPPHSRIFRPSRAVPRRPRP